MTTALSKNRSRNADAQTPSDWRHVNLVEDFDGWRLTVGLTDSFVGFQTCAAAKIPKASELTFAEAIDYGMKLERWLQSQEKLWR